MVWRASFRMLPTTVVVVLLGLVVTHETIGQNSFPRDLQAAERGDWGAIIAVGHDYMYGNGTDKNWERAEYWFRRLPFSLTMSANEQTYADQAFVSLGVIYMNGGWGVAKNPTYARYYLERIDPNGIHGDERQRFLKNLNDSQQTDSSSAATTSNTVKTQATYGQSGGQNAASQGTCAAVYIVVGSDETYGHHFFYGAAWSRSSYADALAGAKSELMRVAVGDEVDPRQLPDAGGQYAAKPEEGSGCTYAHGAVAGKLKIAPGGGSIYNIGGAAGTSTLGPGIYDVIAAGFASSTDAAISAAISNCRTSNGSGDNDHETCVVLRQW